MTPLLAILLIATTPTTPPATIEPTHHQEAPTIMAIQYPERHPNAGPMRGPGTTFNRIGRDASNPQRAAHGYPPLGANSIPASSHGITPTEHTSRGK